jgi:hypothetical protein
VSDGNPNDINAPESLIWLSPDATIDLGQFNKNDYKEGKESIIKQTHEADFFNPEDSKEEPTYADVYLKFEMLQPQPNEDLLLGSALIQVHDLINLNEPATCKSLLLLTPKENGKGIEDYRNIIVD